MNNVPINCKYEAMELEKIIELARKSHAGQQDKAGRDYFAAHLTPITAGAEVFCEQAVKAAWLHDIIEDTDLSAEDLLSKGVDQEVVNAVVSVTRREDETYAELIGRACANEIGRLVKLVDNAWNITSSPALAAINPAEAQSMLENRYYPARERLLAAAGLSLESPVLVEMQTRLDEHHRGTGADVSATVP